MFIWQLPSVICTYNVDIIKNNIIASVAFVSIQIQTEHVRIKGVYVLKTKTENTYLWIYRGNLEQSKRTKSKIGRKLTCRCFYWLFEISRYRKIRFSNSNRLFFFFKFLWIQLNIHLNTCSFFFSLSTSLPLSISLFLSLLNMLNSIWLAGSAFCISFPINPRKLQSFLYANTIVHYSTEQNKKKKTFLCLELYLVLV